MFESLFTVPSYLKVNRFCRKKREGKKQIQVTCRFVIQLTKNTWFESKERDYNHVKAKHHALRTLGICGIYIPHSKTKLMCRHEKKQPGTS